jgi:ABC-2 type transport system permease protein
MALGLFLSAFATKRVPDHSVRAGLPLPAALLAGLLVPRERMPDALEAVSDALPITYACDALARVTADDTSSWFWLDIAIVADSIALALVLGATTLRSRTP